MRDLGDEKGSAVMAFLSCRSKPAIVAIGIILVILLGVADFTLGAGLRFFLFYWPPIAIVAWFASRRWAYALAAFAGLTWILANWKGDLSLDAVSVTAWNLAVNCFSFAFLGHVIARLREYVDLERETARTDSLTEVSNGRAFREVLAAQMARSQRSGERFTVAYMDVDNFKAVNDRFGHEEGDELLRTIATTLRQALRGADVVARLGGDEFSVLLPGTGAEEGRAVIERVVADLKAAAARGEWPVSFSVGVVTCTGDTAPSTDLLQMADRLMYAVKSRGKDGVEYLVDARSPAAPSLP